MAQNAPAGDVKRPDPLKPDLVKDFVIAAHGNLDKTQAMLAETPRLLNATWDWGGGDFEMAIGGAGHMGRRDIALFLISQGGRFDLFVAAMLGRLDVVKPMLTAFPSLADSKGPHGIPLMAHAQKGGQDAAEVAAFLESLKSKSA
ncbi:MAG TPA: ankyrin repeat domain-containing protein [Candidatus Angelobacter sp.]|nr:ankyrin repeat domain-containing protein [Candidatus Angelobacter sp.]